MQKVDIGHARGWLAPAPAASIRRIDRQLGRPADINDAGRSPEQADENYRRWIAYQNGGPWAPYALPSWLSVHCKGEAADSDDWYDPAAAGVWRDNGWRQTARYGDDRDEPWHGEYFENLDNHRNDKEDDMSAKAEQQIQALHDAVFRGGNSMKDNGASISDSLGRIARDVSPIYRGGKAVSLRQEIADTKTKVYALEAALTALAGAQGADPDALAGIVETAVKDAMREVTVTVDIDAAD